MSELLVASSAVAPSQSRRDESTPWASRKDTMSRWSHEVAIQQIRKRGDSVRRRGLGGGGGGRNSKNKDMYIM